MSKTATSVWGLTAQTETATLTNTFINIVNKHAPLNKAHKGKSSSFYD